MSSITDALAALLSTVRTPGDFHAAGKTELALPALKVDGVGTIALPLLPSQAAQLIAVAERAPYGRGADTLVDAAVRRTLRARSAARELGLPHGAGVQPAAAGQRPPAPAAEP